MKSKIVDYSKKVTFLIIIFGILLNISLSYKNINNFDNYRDRSDGVVENYLIRSDILYGWKSAENVRQNLEENNFFEAIPVNDRWFLPCILIGFYFYIIDQEIFVNEKINENDYKIKKNNGKLGFLILQIILFYLSLNYLNNKLKKKFSQKSVLIIILFLSFEPTIFQWHSSFWSESIYLSLLLFLLGKIINLSQKNSRNLFIGVIVGIMFAQRSASFLLIIPILVYYIIFFKKKFKPYFFLMLGYFFVIIFIGLNHKYKTDTFFILPYHSQLYSNYHYMLHEMKARSENKSVEIALREKNLKEEIWLNDNGLNNNNLNDIFLIIKYKNNEFIKEVIKNPINSAFYLLGKISQAAILDPFWVKKNLYLDKSVKNYYLEFNQDIIIRFVYSVVFYIVCLIGFLYIIHDYFNKKKYFKLYNFLVLNILIIAYFYLFAGGYGVSRYFVPTLISYSFFFILGLNFIFEKIKHVKFISKD